MPGTVMHLLSLLMLAPGLIGSVPSTDASRSVVPATTDPGAFQATSGPGVVPETAARPRPRIDGPAHLPGSAASAHGVWPLRPRPEVVAHFDPPLTRYGSGHRGVDLSGREGQRVRAAVAGRVTFAGSIAGRGVVVVSHGATRTTYEPVRATVRVGTVVGTGESIGTLQAHASHCAPAACLHWGLVQGDTYLDPLTLVGGGPVRLLPLFGLVPG